ncbi:hypothetical protein CTAYLR_002101 [Chrysophaeum taylorii]|uniref:Uncharacterized protein n=1 Tax=Chrysophaeum taylorii TaxID=2483200 RepID=A0AAD7UP08_9STRA|nr:hypothetical protein CTAYLR_002101 [Chrysophaeum taylorii]
MVVSCEPVENATVRMSRAGRWLDVRGDRERFDRARESVPWDMDVVRTVTGHSGFNLDEFCDVECPDPRDRNIEQHGGYRLVVRGKGPLTVVVPWFLKWFPSKSTADGRPVLDRSEFRPPRGRDHGSILANASEVVLVFEPRYLPTESDMLIPPATSPTGYSYPLLVKVPRADFSMPFNVVTIQSTLIAFFFGSVASILVRKSSRTPS